MKILHIINYYQEGFGYQENYLTREQINNGHDVLVVTSEYYYPFPGYEKTMRHKLGRRRVGNGEFYDGPVKIVRKRALFSRLSPGLILFSPIGEIVEYRPEVIHVHGATSLWLLLVFLARLVLRFRLFVDSHQDEMVERYTDNALYRNFYRFWRFVYHGLRRKNAVCRFLPVTPSAGEWLHRRLRIGPDLCALSPLGVDLSSMFYSPEAEREIREMYRLEPDRLVVINAGKQYPKKHILWIIEVCRFAREKGADVFLILVGNAEGEYDRRIESALGELGDGNYARVPFLDRTSLRDYYSTADVGIWPGIPSNTIQEAMACKVSLMLPQNKIVGHLIDGNGTYIDVSAVETASRDLYALYRDPDTLEQMKNRSIELAQRFSWERINRDLEKLYEYR